jgi:hypothetical protein
LVGLAAQPSSQLLTKRSSADHRPCPAPAVPLRADVSACECVVHCSADVEAGAGRERRQAGERGRGAAAGVAGRGGLWLLPPHGWLQGGRCDIDKMTAAQGSREPAGYALSLISLARLLAPQFASAVGLRTHTCTKTLFHWSTPETTLPALDSFPSTLRRLINKYTDGTEIRTSSSVLPSWRSAP